MTTTNSTVHAAQLGFTPASTQAPRRLIANIEGADKTGKTHLALTAAKSGPVFYIGIDAGEEGVVEKFQREHGNIEVKRYSYDHYESKEQQQAHQTEYAAIWEDIESTARGLAAINEGTVIFDTGGELWEVLRLAEFGRLSQVMPHHYVQANSKMTRFMKRWYDTRMSAIFCHKIKPVWVNNNRTADFELTGFNDTPYVVQINIRTYLANPLEGETKPVPTAWIKNCRQNMNLTNQQMSGGTFDFNVITGAAVG